MTRYPLLNDFDLFDDVFGVPMFSSDRIMRTDVEESDDHYTLKMDLPGYQKEDVTVSLNRGLRLPELWLMSLMYYCWMSL